MSGATQQPSVWQEVRRRRVWKVVVAYIAASFFGVEVALWSTPLTGLTELGFRALVGAFVLGFPTAVVLSWTYDLTPTGVVRTPEDGLEELPSKTRFTWLGLTAAWLIGGLVLELIR